MDAGDSRRIKFRLGDFEFRWICFQFEDEIIYGKDALHILEQIMAISKGWA